MIAGRLPYADISCNPHQSGLPQVNHRMAAAVLDRK
jgi:hypothetical protein